MIFGKSISEYARFEKVVLWAIALVAFGRLALSLAGVPNSAVKWLSITVVSLLGLVYVSIRVHTAGFGSFKQLLPLIFLQSALAHSIIVCAIVLSILMSKDNIFSAPEFSGGGNGRTWQHVIAHLAAGFLVVPLVGWLIGSLILLITKKVAPRGTESSAAARA